MPKLHIRLFGKCCIRRDGQVVTDLDASKAQELLFYLLLHRDRPHAREALADLLWSDCSGSQSRKYLRQALWKLHTVLDPGACPRERRTLLVDPVWLSLNLKADLWLDVSVFEQTFARTERMPGERLAAGEVQAMQEAVDLYQGDLLPDWYQDWCLFERERLQNCYLMMLTKLVTYCDGHGLFELGMAHGRRILYYDRAHERTHRSLMRMHYRAGDRTAALRQYQRCVAALSEELEVGPEESTVALYEHIRAERLDGLEVTPVEATRDPPASAPSQAAVGGSIQQLRTILHHFERQIQRLERDIEVVERRVNESGDLREFPASSGSGALRAANSSGRRPPRSRARDAE